MAYTSFYPPLRLLMGAGPSTLHPRVSQALSKPLISHLDKRFHNLFVETQELLRYTLQTTASMTLPIHGPGSTAMEACIANLVEPGEHIAILSNGIYGQRMYDIATRYNAKTTLIQHSWGEALCANRLELVLKENSAIKLVCFVHGESATGVMSDVKALSSIAQKYGVLTLCDIAATVGGYPLFIDKWGLDAVYANPQKCLSCAPGLAPLSLSERALHKIQRRKTPVANWCLDLTTMHTLAMSKPLTRFYPYTSPVHCFYALHEALLMIYEEGLERVWKRHEMNARALSEGLKILGFKHMTVDDIRIPQVNVVAVPRGISANQFRDYTSDRFHLEISDGMGEWFGKTLRIGIMGQTCVAENIFLCLSVLGQTLQHFGRAANIDGAVAVSKKYAFYDAEDAFSQNFDATSHASVA